MAEMSEQTGEGTIYDTDDNELGTVSYRIAPVSSPDSDVDSWGGDLYFPDATMTLDPGLYVLSLGDGTQVDIDLDPAGSAEGDPRHVTFNGVGTFGQRIL